MAERLKFSVYESFSFFILFFGILRFVYYLTVERLNDNSGFRGMESQTVDGHRGGAS
jgi:hypothetical protein